MDIHGVQRSTTRENLRTGQPVRVTGPGASAIKYDILTALLVTATRDDTSSTARLALRLSVVITARFNWNTGLFNVGQRELARMWGVTERTAKRELALLRSLGWISVERAAARGRVTQYRIVFTTLLRDTMINWDAVGPDFAARMTGYPEKPQQAPDNVVALRAKTVTVPAQDGTIWPDVASELERLDPALYAAWFTELTFVEIENDHVVLAAPNRFSASYVETHLQTRLLTAFIAHDRSVRAVRVIAADDLNDG